MHSRLKNTQQRGRVLSGRDGPESVVEKRRNWWSRWTGIGGRDQTDSVVAMDRITHSDTRLRFNPRSEPSCKARWRHVALPFQTHIRSPIGIGRTNIPLACGKDPGGRDHSIRRH